MIASGFTWFNAIAFLDEDPLRHTFFGSPNFNVTTLFCAGLLATLCVLVFSLLGRMALGKALARPEHERYEAHGHLSVLTVVETFGTFIRNMMADVMPRHEVGKFSAFVSALFLYILFCNLQGIVPGLAPPTDNMSANFGMAVASFIVFLFVGLYRDARGFIGHLMGPSLFIAPLLLPVETLSLVLRPVTLGVRLTGNLFGDHTVFSIFSGIVPFWLPIVFPLLMLATFVSLIQAYVFSLLTSIYIGQSLPHDDHH